MRPIASVLSVTSAWKKIRRPPGLVFHTSTVPSCLSIPSPSPSGVRTNRDIRRGRTLLSLLRISGTFPCSARPSDCASKKGRGSNWYDMSGAEVTRLSVPGLTGFGRKYKCSGILGIVDGADCNKVNCLRSVGGRRSMFYGSSNESLNLNQRRLNSNFTHSYGLHDKGAVRKYTQEEIPTLFLNLAHSSGSPVFWFWTDSGQCSSERLGHNFSIKPEDTRARRLGSHREGYCREDV